MYIIDPLAEKYAYNSPYALQENKFGLGVELEGKEMAEFSKTARFPWHEQQQQSQTKISPIKLNVKEESSLGLQGGAEGTLLGIKLGAFVNFGSVKTSNFSADLLSDNKEPQNELSDSYTIEHEVSAGVGFFGGKVKYSHGASQDGSKKSDLEYAINLGPVEVEFKEGERIDNKGIKTNTSETNIKIAHSSARGGAIGKIEGGFDLIIPMSSGTYKNYSSTDATRKDNTNSRHILELLKK